VSETNTDAVKNLQVIISDCSDSPFVVIILPWMILLPAPRKKSSGSCGSECEWSRPAVWGMFVYMHWGFVFVFKLTPLVVYLTSYYEPGLFCVKLFLKGTISYRLFACSLLADLLSTEFCHTIIAKNPENQKFFFIIVVYLFACLVLLPGILCLLYSDEVADPDRHDGATASLADRHIRATAVAVRIDLRRHSAPAQTVLVCSL